MAKTFAGMSSKGESISHFNAVRIRVTGAGNLKLQFQSSDDIEIQTLVPFVLELQTNKQPTRLANFKQQRARLEIKTTEINEIFSINRIIVFAKPLFTSYPA